MAMNPLTRIRFRILGAIQQLRERREIRSARHANTRVLTDPVAFNVMATGVIIAMIWYGVSRGLEAYDRYNAEGLRRVDAINRRLEARTAREKERLAAACSSGETVDRRGGEGR